MEANITFIIECLKRDIEQKLNRSMLTPSDFNFLSVRIMSECGEQISMHTLMRVWGYLNSKSQPSIQTLSLLSRFVGYDSISKYLLDLNIRKSRGSMFIETDIVMTDALRPGDMVSLEWYPARVVKLEYIGEYRFRVVENQNSRLKEGDELKCVSFARDAPFTAVVSDVEKSQNLTYIGGKEGGLTCVAVSRP